MPIVNEYSRFRREAPNNVTDPKSDQHPNINNITYEEIQNLEPVNNLYNLLTDGNGYGVTHRVENIIDEIDNNDDQTDKKTFIKSIPDTFYEFKSENSKRIRKKPIGFGVTPQVKKTIIDEKYNETDPTDNKMLKDTIPETGFEFRSENSKRTARRKKPMKRAKINQSAGKTVKTRHINAYETHISKPASKDDLSRNIQKAVHALAMLVGNITHPLYTNRTLYHNRTLYFNRTSKNKTSSSHYNTTQCIQYRKELEFNHTVFRNFFRAQNVSSGSVCLITQLANSRLHMLRKVAQHWTGNMAFDNLSYIL